MDDRWANIDLVFRNGLKQYEVLPPAEVWNNIKPVIRKKSLPFIVLRAAAMLAVLLSLSFIAYRLSVQLSTVPEINTIAQAPESESRSVSDNDELPPVNAGTTVRQPVTSEAFEPEIQPEIYIIPHNDLNIIRSVIFQPEADRISINDRTAVRPDFLVISQTRIDAVSFEENETTEIPSVPAKGEPNRWTIAALVSPTYYTNFYSGNREAATQMKSEEQPLFSYSGGVAFSYKINGRLSVQSGLYYSSFGQELSGITTFGGFQQYDYTKGDHNFKVLTSSGIVYTNNADVYLLDNLSDNRIATMYTNDVFDPAKANLQYMDNSLRQNFSYLELPVIMRYKLIDKTIDFNVIGGLSSNVLVNNAVYTSMDGSRQQVGKTEGLNLITFSSSLGLGMEYSFTNNLSLNLEPTFRYYLNPFSEMPGLKIHPYSFGVFSGLSFRF